jgi:hypothetical protein
VGALADIEARHGRQFVRLVEHHLGNEIKRGVEQGGNQCLVIGGFENWLLSSSSRAGRAWVREPGPGVRPRRHDQAGVFRNFRFERFIVIAGWDMDAVCQHRFHPVMARHRPAHCFWDVQQYVVMRAREGLTGFLAKTPLLKNIESEHQGDHCHAQYQYTDLQFAH